MFSGWEPLSSRVRSCETLSKRGQDLRLFIADDNREFAEFCAEVATRAGWTVCICGNGAELVEQVQAQDGPALLFIDIQMPVLDGIEVIEELKTLDRDLRVRFMTGGPQSSALAARMIADARGLTTGRFLTKPLSIDQLRKVLAEEWSA